MNGFKDLMKQYKPRRYANECYNGNFLNGGYGHTSNQVTKSISGEECTLTIVTTGTTIGLYTDLNFRTIKGGNKYFICADYNFNKVGYARIGIDADKTYTQVTELNTWKTIGRVVTPASDNLASVFYADVSDNHIAGDTFKVRRLIVHNLTETFGSGSEPSLSWCYQYLAPNIDYWNFISGLRNGDGLENTTNWTPSYCTIQENNGIFKITGNTSSTFARGINMSSIPCVSGNKVYVYAKEKALTSGLDAHLRMWGSTTAGTTQYIQQSAVVGTEYEMSSIFTIQADMVGYCNIACQLASPGSTNGAEMEFRDVIAIDLTTVFGAGREPDLATCNNVIRLLINMKRWFNRITNGDFSNGTSGWNFGTGTTYSVSNNEVTISNCASTWYEMGMDLYFVSGRSYYMFSNIKTTGTQDGIMLLNVNEGVFHSGSGNYELISFTFTVDTDGSYNARFINSSRTGDISADPIKAKQCGVIDLSALFGLGNEPSKEWCDTYIAPFINY